MQSLSFLFVLSFSLSLHATGVDTSGGGKGLVCRGNSGEVLSVELLDLWEMRIIHGKNVAKSQLSIQERIVEGLKEMNNLFVYDRSQQLDGLKETALDVLGLLPHSDPNRKSIRGAELTLTSDSFEDIKPIETSSCRVEQIVNYKIYPKLVEVLVNDDLLDKMDDANKVALGLHEAFYSYLRIGTQEKNSLRTRRVVGNILAGEKFKNFQEKLSQPHIECSNHAASPKEWNQTIVHYIEEDWSVDPNYKTTVVPLAAMVGDDSSLVELMGMEGEVNFGGKDQSVIHSIDGFFQYLLQHGHSTGFAARSELSPELETQIEMVIRPGGQGTVLMVSGPGIDHPTVSDVKCVKVSGTH